MVNTYFGYYLWLCLMAVSLIRKCRISYKYR